MWMSFSKRGCHHRTDGISSWNTITKMEKGTEVRNERAGLVDTIWLDLCWHGLSS
jgi:hypothetical protein